MKTTKTLIAAFTSLALFAGTAYAQYTATENDGITASPKLREMINSRAAVSAQPADPAKHLCPGCKDEYTTRVDYTAKGATKPTVLVAKDVCLGCETTMSMTGQGKAARDLVTHKCASGGTGTASCCATKKT